MSVSHRLHFENLEQRHLLCGSPLDALTEDHQLSVVDFDGDADLDIVGSQTWHENRSGQFVCNLLPIPFGGNGFNGHLRSAVDLDGDGDLDLLIGNRYYERIDGTNEFGVESVFGRLPRELTAPTLGLGRGLSLSEYELGDFDNDGDVDLVTSYRILGDNRAGISWFENNGAIKDAIAGDFGIFPPIFTAADQTELENFFSGGEPKLALGDLDGDGYLDILRLSSSSQLSWFRNDPGNPPEANQVIGTEAWGNEMTVADIDQDGDMDIVNAVIVFENEGDGGFVRHQVNRESPIPFGGAQQVADFDNDGDIDIVAASGGDGVLAWYENNGTLTSPWTRHVIAQQAGGDIEVIDFENDGDLDLVAANGDVLFYVNDGQGGFTEGVSVPGDFDGNAEIDVHDIGLLCGATQSPALTEEQISLYDQNEDQAVTTADVDAWLANVVNTNRGDSDLDGDVDFADFLQLSSQFGTSDALWSDGDFNCDGEVTFADFLVLSANFGATS